MRDGVRHGNQFGFAIMPAHFSIKALFAATAVVALWMATSVLPDPLGIEPGGKIRSAMMLTILIMSGFAVLYLRGKRQAFWAGFFITMGLFWMQSKWFPTPNLSDAAISLAYYAPVSGGLKALLTSTIFLMLLVGFSTVAGIAAAYFYDLNQKDDDRANSRAKRN